MAEFVWDGRIYTTELAETVAVAEPAAQPVVKPGSRHVSIDLETLGIRADALILSIGAVAFDPATGEQTDEGFYRIIDIADAVGGGVIDASTVMWWMNQSQVARDEVFGAANKDQRVNLRVALAELSEYLGFDESIPEGKFPDIELWQRGTKDEAWLEAGYKGMQLAVPFTFWQWNDQRTFTKHFKQFMPERGDLVAHNAFDDALYQAVCVGAVFKRIGALGHDVNWKPVRAEKVTTVVNEGMSLSPEADNELAAMEVRALKPLELTSEEWAARIPANLCDCAAEHPSLAPPPPPAYLMGNTPGPKPAN